LFHFTKAICLENENLQNKKWDFYGKITSFVKSDCIQRKLAGQIIAGFENGGPQHVACQIINVDDNLLKDHYSPDTSAIFS
jgi:nucleoside diphosphate kinase